MALSDVGYLYGSLSLKFGNFSWIRSEDTYGAAVTDPLSNYYIVVSEEGCSVFVLLAGAVLRRGFHNTEDERAVTEANSDMNCNFF